LILIYGSSGVWSPDDLDSVLPTVVDIRILPGVLEDAHEDAGDHLPEAEGGLALAFRDASQEGFFHGEVEEWVRDPLLQ
jgi:hypothetical protein